MWRRKLPLAAFVLAMACWSRVERAATVEQLRAIEARLGAGSEKGAQDAQGDGEAKTVTVRAVGSGGIILEGRGVLRVGESIDGWSLETIEGGVASLRRGDALARVRSGGVFDPASGVVTR